MTTSSLNTDRQQQLRKAAILVATLDEALAERLLADLPAEEAAAVQRIVAQLEDIDPAEYRVAVADFQRGIAAPPRQRAVPSGIQFDGVELDASLHARMATEASLHSSQVVPPVSAAARDAGPWRALGDTDAQALVDMLSAEQPQTVAVVLSKLEAGRAAELIGNLSPPLQADVLTRLADLDPTDEQTLEVVESQLAKWIKGQRQRQQRLAAGRDLVQRILQNSSAGQRVALLTHLGDRNPALAKALFVEAQVKPPQAAVPDGILSHSQRPESEAMAAPLTTDHSPAAAAPAPPATAARPTTESSDPLRELEALDDQALLAALRRADRKSVMLALAGASEKLMKRIVQGLPRRQARQFRQQVRAIGPARLSDLLAAQHELLRCGKLSTPVIPTNNTTNSEIWRQ